MKTIFNFSGIKKGCDVPSFVTLSALGDGTFIRTYKFSSMVNEEVVIYTDEYLARNAVMKDILFILSLC